MNQLTGVNNFVWDFEPQMVAYLKEKFIEFASQPQELITEVDKLSVMILHNMIEEGRELRSGKVFFSPAQAYSIRCLYRYTKIAYNNVHEEEYLFEEFESIYDGVDQFLKPLSSPIQ